MVHNAGGAVLAIVASLLLAGCASSDRNPGSPEPFSSVRPAPSPSAPGGASPPLDLPVPRSGLVSSGSEPMVLADRAGKYVWIGDTSGGYYSTNNGTRWSSMPSFMLPGVFRDGWALAQDEKGRLYAASTQGSDVDVARSSNGGQSWDAITRGAGLSTTSDRPWLAARGDGEVSLIYFDAPAAITGFYEHCARSRDAGATWLERNPIAGTPHTGGLVYDAQGAMYFLDSSGLMRKFATGCSVTSTLQFFSNMGSVNMLQTAIDATGIYASGVSAGNAGILLGGTKNFQTVKRLTVSPPELKSNAYPTVAVHNGTVAVAWYGSTTAGNPNSDAYAGSFHTYLAIVQDFWDSPTVDHYRLTTSPNHVGPICMGGVLCQSDRDLLDYFGTAFDKWGGVHVAYVHDGTGDSPTVYHVHMKPEEVRLGLGPSDPGVAPFNAGISFTPRTPKAGEVVSFRDASDDPDGSIVAWSWSFGDGGESTLQNPTYVFQRPGAFLVSLVVTSKSGATDRAGAIVEVQDDGRPASPSPSGSDDPSGGAAETLDPRSGGGTTRGVPFLSFLLAVAVLAGAAVARRRD